MNTKPKVLLYETISYMHVDYSDFENLIEDEYGHEFNICQDLETGNDTDHTFEMKVEELNNYVQGVIETFKKEGQSSKHRFISNYLLQDFVNKGYIPPGKIIIRISW